MNLWDWIKSWFLGRERVLLAKYAKLRAKAASAQIEYAAKVSLLQQQLEDAGHKLADGAAKGLDSAADKIRKL